MEDFFIRKVGLSLQSYLKFIRFAGYFFCNIYNVIVSGNSQYDAFPSLIGICRSVSAKKVIIIVSLNCYYCFGKNSFVFCILKVHFS